MHYFPKINAPFKREVDGPNRGKFIPLELLRGLDSKFYGAIEDFADPNFHELLDVAWIWSEKFDGMSSGIHFHEDGSYTIFGRTKKTKFSADQMDAMQDAVETYSKFAGSGLTLYGELVGPSLQGNPHRLYYHDFIPFDMAYGKVFWDKGRLAEEVGGHRGEVRISTLRHALSMMIYEEKPYSYYQEGFVGTPELCNLKGERIITKLKWKDFE